MRRLVDPCRDEAAVQRTDRIAPAVDIQSHAGSELADEHQSRKAAQGYLDTLASECEVYVPLGTEGYFGLHEVYVRRIGSHRRDRARLGIAQGAQPLPRVGILGQKIGHSAVHRGLGDSRKLRYYRRAELSPHGELKIRRSRQQNGQSQAYIPPYPTLQGGRFFSAQHKKHPCVSYAYTGAWFIGFYQDMRSSSA